MKPGPSRSRGTVTLVALCCVAVMGIGLASFLAISNQAMRLSNRTARDGLSQQLAEMGIEEAMRAFNKNDWSDWTNSGISADWTVTGTTATCNLTFPANKFGQGVTGSVKIRIDNYNASKLDSTWSNTANYRVNNLVGYNGTWYRCVRDANTGNTPGVGSLQWWVPVPYPWAWSSNNDYTANYDIVCYAGDWWRCTTTHTSGATFNWSNWSWIPAPKLAWTSSTSYAVGEFVQYANTWYRCTSGHFSGGSFDGTKFTVASWSYASSVTYSFNDLVMSGGVWYRYINASPTSGNTPAVGAYWEYARSGSMWGWNSSSINYNLGDLVYYSSTIQWYRCIRAHTSSGSITPSNATYWSNAPLFSSDWDSGRQYSQHDTVRYNGVWYRSLQNSNINQNPVTATTWWIGANTATASYKWDAATAYSVGDYRCYGGVWYRCTTAHTGQSPNNSAYWTATWAHSAGVTTGAPVVYAEGTIAFAGSPSLRTQLRATIAPAPLFPNAAAATTTISATSGGTVDSYDSVTDPTAATPGYSAVLAAGNPSSTAVTLSGALTVSGYVAAPSASTSPYAPLFSYGTSTVVKGTAATPSPKVDLSRVSRSPYIPQFDTLPIGGLATNWATTPKGTLLPTATTVNLGTPGATTPSRYYYPSDLIMGGGSSVITTMNINGPVILYIDGDLILNGSPAGKINIYDKGSAEIHASGGFRIFSTSAGIYNQTLDPNRLILISDNTSAPQHYNSITTPLLYGVIYAPNTTHPSGFQFNSGGGASATQYGAISAAKITYTNDMNLHYDTSLRYATFGGVDQPYSVTDWRELPQSEQATMP